MHRQAEFSARLLDRTRRAGLAAAGRPVRLGEHGRESMRCGQRLERRDGEFGRAGEAQPQGRRPALKGSKEPARDAREFAARGSLLALFFQRRRIS